MHLLSYRKFIVIMSVSWGCLAFAAFLGALLSADGNAQLTILLSIPALLLGSAAIVVSCTSKLIPCPSFDIGGKLILLAGTLIYILVAARLFCFEHYGGNVTTLDFGDKVCDDSGCEENLAFTFSFNTIGHFILGFLVFLLYDDIFIGVCSCSDCEWVCFLMHNIKELLPLIGCGYPPYSFIKRMVSEYTVFGSSSHWNNCCEWAFGFAIGVCAIYPFHAILHCISDVTWFDLEDRIASLKPYRVCRLPVGGVLLMTFFGSLIMLIATWNSSVSGL